ncbi:MAG: hypothetical protein IVW57_14500 [Ktedonobacterales bacterium]|nr:hypothetical protein [Ktedonobacterales bacterium]
MAGDADTRPDGQRETDQSARDRRQQAIHQLAGQYSEETAPAPAAGATQASVFGRPSIAWRKRVLVGGGVLLIAAVLLGLVGHQLFAPRPTALRTMLALHVAEYGYSCPTSVAWSPDGSRIAVLARHGQCSSTDIGQDLPGGVLIYAAKSGRLLAQFPLADQQAYSDRFFGSSYLAAFALSWSPDGQRLVLPYLELPLATGTPTPRAAMASGIWLLALADGRLQRLSTSARDRLTIWNTRRTTSTALANPLPVALSYRWTADGRIVVDQALPANPAPGLLTSSPHDALNSQQFSLWQAGAVQSFLPSAPTNQSGSTITPQLFFETAIVRWSPDGTYAAVGLPVDLVPLPPLRTPPLPPGDCTVRGYAPCGTTLAPYPDQALRQAVTQMAQLTPDERHAGEGYDMPVAWRPDGRVMATILPRDSLAALGVTTHITLLDTATGSALGTLNPPPFTNELSPPVPAVLFWAPKGDQLAFIETYEGAVVLWQGSSLPEAKA